MEFPTAPMYHPFFVFGGATTGAYVITSFPMGRLFAEEVDGEISERAITLISFFSFAGKSYH